MSTVADRLVVDRGPVRDAALILASRSTLADHVTVEEDGQVTYIAVDDGIPYPYWGSGTQALWHLLCAMAYSRHEVSLYEVISRLDGRNRDAVAAAVAALCGGVR